MGRTLHYHWPGCGHPDRRPAGPGSRGIPGRGWGPVASHRPRASRTHCGRRSEVGKMRIRTGYRTPAKEGYSLTRQGTGPKAPLSPMILLLDIGNTNTHLGLATASRVIKQANIPSATWSEGKAKALVAGFIAKARLKGAMICS